MTSLLEFNARAALCRRLARLEPNSKDLWLAEAERWCRLKPEPSLVAVICQDEVAVPRWWNAKRKRRPKDVGMAEGHWNVRSNTAGMRSKRS
jgi:hypothetical protein